MSRANRILTGCILASLFTLSDAHGGVEAWIQINSSRTQIERVFRIPQIPSVGRKGMLLPKRLLRHARLVSEGRIVDTEQGTVSRCYKRDGLFVDRSYELSGRLKATLPPPGGFPESWTMRRYENLAVANHQTSHSDKSGPIFRRAENVASNGWRRAVHTYFRELSAEQFPRQHDLAQQQLALLRQFGVELSLSDLSDPKKSKGSIAVSVETSPFRKPKGDHSDFSYKYIVSLLLPQHKKLQDTMYFHIKGFAANLSYAPVKLDPVF